LCDIQYVAYGLLVVYGVDGDVEFRSYIVEKYEMLDICSPTNLRSLSNFNNTREFISKLLNGNSFYVMPKTFLDNQGFLKYVEELGDSYTRLEQATNNKRFNDTIRATMDVIYNTYVLGILLGVDLDESTRMVHESNMSKICSSDEEAQTNVDWYRKNETRYDSPNFRKSEFTEGFVVFNESTGKILKNVNYHAVDLRKFLE